jgi:hypothetical protein
VNSAEPTNQQYIVTEPMFKHQISSMAGLGETERHLVPFGPANNRSLDPDAIPLHPALPSTVTYSMYGDDPPKAATAYDPWSSALIVRTTIAASRHILQCSM